MSFVLVTWMIALGLLMVLGAVLSAVLGRRDDPPPAWAPNPVTSYR